MHTEAEVLEEAADALAEKTYILEENFQEKKSLFRITSHHTKTEQQ